MPERRHDFEARLRFLPPEEGGRSAPVYQGYRADFRYDNDLTDQLWMIWPVFINQSGVEIAPATPITGTVQARMYIVNDELRRGVHQSRIHEGLRFWMHEGPHAVAEGRVTKIVGLHDESQAA